MKTFLPAEDDLILGCVSEETAYLVDDYPYGRLRTQIRYWIESVAGKGDRFVAQTKNPKNGVWNKPKKSTYSALKLMYLEPQDGGRLFVKTTGLSMYSDTADVEAAIDLVGADFLNDVQKRELAKIIGMNKVMDHVTFSIHEGPTTPEYDAEQNEIKRNIDRAIAGAAVQALKELS